MQDLFTYKSIEVTNPNIEDIELLKENGESLEKYHKQISDLITKAKSGSILKNSSTRRCLIFLATHLYKKRKELKKKRI